MSSSEIKKIVFTETDDSSLDDKQKLELENRTEDLLYSLYGVVSPSIAAVLDAEGTRDNEIDRLVYEPISRVCTFWLMKTLKDRRGQALAPDEWAEAALGSVDIDEIKKMSGLQTDSDAQAAIQETARVIVSPGILQGQVTVLYEKQLGSLEIV
jgi:hypothetical protein